MQAIGSSFQTTLDPPKTTTNWTNSKVRSLIADSDTLSVSAPRTLSAKLSCLKNMLLMSLAQEVMFLNTHTCTFIISLVKLVLNGTINMRLMISSLVTRSKLPTLMVIQQMTTTDLTLCGTLLHAHLLQMFIKLSYHKHNLSSSKTNFIQLRWSRKTHAAGPLIGQVFGRDVPSSKLEFTLRVSAVIPKLPRLLPSPLCTSHQHLFVTKVSMILSKVRSRFIGMRHSTMVAQGSLTTVSTTRERPAMELKFNVTIVPLMSIKFIGLRNQSPEQLSSSKTKRDSHC